MQNWRNYFAKPLLKGGQGFATYRSNCLTPNINAKDELSKKEMEEKVKQIFTWARQKGAQYFTFFAYPLNEGVLEKQETFLSLEYFYKHTLQNTGKMDLSLKTLEKGESDGSSFPSGGLRQTPHARAYTIWDLKSEVYVRPVSKVLYIPSLLVSHNGEALDDKTIFRRAEKKLETSVIQLLGKLQVDAQAAVIALGLEQEFFVIRKDAYQKRLDIRNTGRALAGKLPPKTQQFSDHYYGKLPRKIEEVLTELEEELLQIGIPVKTRHKEVAPNQFEFVPLFDEAGKTIDRNMIMMEIFKEKFDKAGLSVLFHEKPFKGINGSGKHANFSLNYIDKEGEMNNLFEIPKDGDEHKTNIFKLFVLIQLRALLKHSKLYMASIACCGNELRLGGHEAPPRILSAFLGDAATSLILGKKIDDGKNFKEDIPNLNFDIFQENTDRNRTSPYAFTGNKFEYRAVGSSQNVSFPMAVIAGTLAKQIDLVVERLENNQTLEQIIAGLKEETQSVVYNGDGYSQAWIEQAKKRGLYVNDKFQENYTNINEAGQVLVQLGICKSNQIAAKAKSLQDIYKKTVQNELVTLQHIIGSEIIPRCYQFCKIVEGAHGTQRITQRSKKFYKYFDILLEHEQILENWKCEGLQDYAALRRQIDITGQNINDLLVHLPKRSSWPEFEDFINDY